MIFFLLFLKILNVISWKAFICLEIFETLAMIYRTMKASGKYEN